MRNVAANLSSSLGQFYRTSVLSMVDFSSSPSRLNTANGSYSSGGSQFKKIKRFVKSSPYFPFIIVAVIVVIIGGVFITKATKNHQSPQVAGTTTQNSQMSVAKPIAQEQLSRSFDFPLKDATGKEVSKIHYEIQSAEEDNQVIIKGQVATAVQGKTFLILNLKITNNYNKAVQLNTRDYVRLIIDNATDKLAADVHNDPVDIQAISTKYTRIGFPVTVDAKNLKLEVGEIDGTKQTIQLNLQ
jgi:type III secretory pathway component EscV